MKLVHYILKLGRLRESRYRDGKTYDLGDLFNTSRSSFGAVVHDKIYVFLGLAKDHFGEISVNYRETPFELYQDVIRFQSDSTCGSRQAYHFGYAKQNLSVGNHMFLR